MLLDALEALNAHRDATILVGAQAIYLHTGEADVSIAPTTKDSDIAIDPALIGDDPLLEEAMTAAGFHRNLETGQPGEWLSADGIPVDLLAPETLVGPAGRRGARLPPHSSTAARKVLGLEAAVVDNATREVGSLLPNGGRRHRVKVAGPAALAVAKLHKLGERVSTPHRLSDKDAHDYYRLVRAVSTEELADGFDRLRGDPRSQAVTEQALEHMASLFGDATSTGAAMAGRAEIGIGDPETVAAAAAVLSGDLLGRLSR